MERELKRPEIEALLGEVAARGPLAHQKMDAGQARELAGRMYECVDLRVAIERGQLKSLAEVVAFVKESAAAIEKELGAAGMIGASKVTAEGFQIEASLDPRTKSKNN